MKLSNKIAVVTGGTSGIGLEAAKRFREEGASVIIVGETNANPSHTLNEGDRVTLIPPLAGG